MRWSKLYTRGSQNAMEAWSATPTEARSTSASATPSDWPKRTLNRWWAARATVMTTPWPKPSMGSTRPNSFIAEDPGNQGGRGVRNARMGVMVQPPSLARTHRVYPASRSRSKLLPATRQSEHRGGGLTQTSSLREFRGDSLSIRKIAKGHHVSDVGLCPSRVWRAFIPEEAQLFRSLKWPSCLSQIATKP